MGAAPSVHARTVRTESRIILKQTMGQLGDMRKSFNEFSELPREKKVTVAVDKIGEMRKSFNELPTSKKVAVGVGCTVGVIAVLATEGAALVPAAVLGPAAVGAKALKKRREEKRAAEDPSCQYSSLIEGVHEAEEDGNAVV